TLISWAVGLFLLGLSYGSVFGDLETFFQDNEMIQQMFAPIKGVSLTEQFITLLMTIIAIISTIPSLMTMLNLIREERKNRMEHLLSRAVSRTKLLGSSLVISIFTSFLMVSLSAIGLWAAGAATMDEPIKLSTIYQAATVYLPAIWLMISVAILLIGFLPKFTILIWVYLIYSFIVVYLGGLLDFPDWLNNLSPYGHIPELPVEEFSVMKSLVFIFLVIMISIIGCYGYRRRDIYG